MLRRLVLLFRAMAAAFPVLVEVVRRESGHRFPTCDRHSYAVYLQRAVERPRRAYVVC